jgi:HEAT repeat protein
VPFGPPTGARPRVPAKPIVVSELIERLRTADSGDRADIIRQLGDTKQAVVPALVKALDDPDPLVKSGVAEVLGNRMDEAVPALPGLIAMMTDRRRAIVPAAPFSYLYALPQPLRLPYDERRYPPIAPKNPENLLRVTAIAAIGKIGLPARTAATDPLTQALQDPNPWVRLNATWALTEIGAQVPLLNQWLDALQSPDPNLRQSAADVFQDSRSLLPKALGAEANDSTAPRLLTTLRDDDPTVRSAAKRALKLLGVGALPKLIQALQAPEPIVRLESASLVGSLGAVAEPAVPALLTLLNDSGQYVSQSASPYSRLLVLPAEAADFDYYPRVPDNPDALVRVNAAIALGKLGDRRAISPLTAALKDKNPWMQLASGWALLVLKQDNALPVVGRLVQHPDTSIQSTALSQLEGYGAQAAPYILPYYKTLLEAKDDYRRNGAIIEAGRFGTAALELVPKLRVLLAGNQRNSPGYAATALGQIAQSTSAAWSNGNLSSQQRTQAIAEFSKVLAIMNAPNARFNRQPTDRVRNALNTLKGRLP